MMQDYRKIFAGIREHSALHELAEQGATPEEVKAVLFGLLSPYLENPRTLERYGLALLVPVAIVVARIQVEPWAVGMFKAVLAFHRAAADVNEQTAFTTYGDWQPEIERGLSHWWSSYYLELDKSCLPLEEFVHETSRTMGSLIEGCLQPLLRELLQLNRCIRGHQVTKQDVDRLDFGVIVNELIATSSIAELLRPDPWRIQIHQWRNMCQHLGFVVRDGQIVGNYGPAHSRRTVILTRAQFLEMLKMAVLVFSIIKEARGLFVLDNLDRIAPYLPDTELRPEQGIVCLASAIATQGFELIDFHDQQEAVSIVVRDVTEGAPERRMLHASQFVCPLWYYFPRDSVTVAYNDKKGQLRLTTVAKGEDCREVAEGILPLEELARRVQFIVPATGE